MRKQHSWIASLRRLLLDPRVRDLDVDGEGATRAHRNVLRDKKMLRDLFARFYRDCRTLDQRYFADVEGNRVELGSGSSIIKDYYPDVITSDIKPLPFTDMQVDAQNMPFADDSVRAIYGINLFHHLPQPRKFFAELLRVCPPGGGAILIEPYHGLAARILFPRLHASEGFDMTAPAWENEAVRGPLSNANQALSYVVFERDRQIFAQEFPGLQVVAAVPHTHLSYLMSGGVNYRQLVPDRLRTLVRGLEVILSPLNRWLALQHVIVLRKDPVRRGVNNV